MKKTARQTDRTYSFCKFNLTWTCFLLKIKIKFSPETFTLRFNLITAMSRFSWMKTSFTSNRCRCSDLLRIWLVAHVGESPSRTPDTTQNGWELCRLDTVVKTCCLLIKTPLLSVFFRESGLFGSVCSSTAIQGWFSAVCSPHISLKSASSLSSLFSTSTTLSDTATIATPVDRSSKGSSVDDL